MASSIMPKDQTYLCFLLNMQQQIVMLDSVILYLTNIRNELADNLAAEAEALEADAKEEARS